jgi:hypothetical protein
MQGHAVAPYFDEIFAKYLGSPCALAQATKEFDAALLAFHQWERARITHVLHNMPR